MGDTACREDPACNMPAAAGVVVAMAGSEVVQFASDAIQAASDTEEAMSKVKVVFGDAADVVTDFAETAADKLGMSKLEALNATGTFGNLFSTMGMGGKEAAAMSVKVTQLAADLGSFNNMPTAEVLQQVVEGLQAWLASAQPTTEGPAAAPWEGPS